MRRRKREREKSENKGVEKTDELRASGRRSSGAGKSKRRRRRGKKSRQKRQLGGYRKSKTGGRSPASSREREATVSSKQELRPKAPNTLEVPVNKQNRSASLDAPYLLKVPERQQLELMYDVSYPLDGDPTGSSSSLLMVAAAKSNRSHSVDISLPTRPGDAYLVRRAEQSGGAGSAGDSKMAQASAASRLQVGAQK